MAVTRKRKIIFLVVILLGLAAVVGISVTQNRQDIPAVEVETVQRRALLESKVTANGEVRPLNSYNLTSEVPGRVLEIFVREGDIVKAGQSLLKIDPAQLESGLAGDLATMRAAQIDRESTEVQLQAARNNVSNVEASLAAARYDLERAKSDESLAKEDFDRAQKLVEQEIFSKAQFDAAKFRYEGAKALVRAQQSRIDQLEAQLRDAKIRIDAAKTAISSADARIAQTKARVNAAQDQYAKTIQKAPIDGVIASLPIRPGQYVLASFQTTPLLTIADMSQVTVEVQVDETDVTSVHPGQNVKIKVDALGESQLDGHVKEVAQAPTTSGGGLESLSKTTQEAKDFKVVINLVNLTGETRNRLKPGMSATATITTDSRQNVLAIPLQAIVQREKPTAGSTAKTSGGAPAAQKETKEEVQGVFVLEGTHARFRPIKTGIIGETDIEVVEGLKEGEQIIVGPYRELRNLKDNTVVKKEKSSTAESSK
ncbi:MAG: HlyD family efflux transporter periplasmic adaptor subunit [Acidobacteria bacterium]|nr:HlyD family efflux transporter periplasmic adaptor subunit [Acidobacteriota bacterium]